MTRLLTRLAISMAAVVLFVAVADYLRLMGRQYVVHQMQRQLAAHVAQRLLADVPALSKRTGFAVGSIGFDTGGLVAESLQRHSPARLEAATRSQIVSDNGSPPAIVDGQIEEWVTDPLPAARLKVALRVTVAGSRMRTYRYTSTAADGLKLETLGSYFTSWEHHLPWAKHNTTDAPWLWQLVAMALPWIGIEVLLSLLRSRSRLLKSVLAVAYLVGIVYAAGALWAEFDQQRGLWCLLLLASGWTLMHFDEDDESEETADGHR